ncbi:fungal-specific transcription factor domain-containing protein [Exophiala viscosa]|uniref:fungal-specific transcription factor domain-containing protein n=1 Tax=Exophiala viscosa TaxID=2486360 RepID=UPI0021955843|nr:fungal-specific transcription factor domain-containing protein [Exophiala viscosa]
MSSLSNLPTLAASGVSPNGHYIQAQYQGPQPSPRGDGHDVSDQSPNESQQYGANSSVIGFARNVFRSNDLASPSITSTIPGDQGALHQPGSRWTLHTMIMPPPPIMRLILKAYFDRVHWFIFLFHEPSFICRAESLLSSSSWMRQDQAAMMAILMAAAMALKCVLDDTAWPGHSLLASYALDAKSLLSTLITEVRLHLLDILDDSQIETVQVCLLLGTYYIYHGSPSLAWSILGMAIRTAYALALHCEDSEDEQKIATQVRHRTWNHVTIADTFAATIYGRPAGLDAAFAQFQPLCEFDDTHVAAGLNHPDQRGHSTTGLSGLSFHILKYRLYSITRQAVDRFRLLRLKDPLSPEDQEALVTAVSQIEAQLVAWQREVPPHLSGDLWQNVDHAGPYPPELLGIAHVNEDQARIFLLQALMAAPSDHSHSSRTFVSRSLEVAIEAALRISRISMLQLNHTLSLSFAFMHFFTAGVILCIPPARRPFSTIAQDAKAGIMRIILACRGLGSSSQIARHIDQLLTALLRVTVLREMDNALLNQVEASVPSLPEQPIERDDRSNDIRLPPTERAFSFHQLPASVMNTDLPAPSVSTQLTGHGEGQFSFDLGSMHDNTGIAFDTQLDEAFGTFGQMMFNLQPDDPYTPWNWGSRSR